MGDSAIIMDGEILCRRRRRDVATADLRLKRLAECKQRNQYDRRKIRIVFYKINLYKSLLSNGYERYHNNGAVFVKFIDTFVIEFLADGARSCR
ncbi:MAG: hypothetical protein KIT59_03710 [Nitrosomonas sp.]|nr:hypothetical protein [Nitrosomonas sp.]